MIGRLTWRADGLFRRKKRRSGKSMCAPWRRVIELAAHGKIPGIDTGLRKCGQGIEQGSISTPMGSDVKS